MEKMENIVFDRNYEEDKPDPLAQAIFDRVKRPRWLFRRVFKEDGCYPKGDSPEG